MKESSKTRLHLSDAERALMRGRVLDIGAGDDPVTPDAVPFDLAHGDAHHGPLQRGLLARRVARSYRSLRKRGWVGRSAFLEHLAASTLGVDQSHGPAMAQIEAVVRKLG